YQIRGYISNADQQSAPVLAAVVEYQPSTGKVYSGDRLKLESGGSFAFLVESPRNQYVVAFADSNRNSRHENGEPFWIHSGPDGKAAPVDLDGANRIANVEGQLSTEDQIPAALRAALDQALIGRRVEEVARHRGVNVTLGKIANLD